jgi:hypothetical protein
VAARRRHRDFVVGVGPLVARPDQPIVIERLPADAVVEDRLEGNALGHDPLVVFHRALAVEPHLDLVRSLAARGHQVLEHLLRRVLEPAGLLERRAPPQVEHPSRHRRGAPTPAGALQHQGLGAAAGRLQCGGRAGRAEADHQDLRLVAPALDLPGVEDTGGHGGPP